MAYIFLTGKTRGTCDGAFVDLFDIGI
uniref:Uncharacterized protein n=1 Tax=Arundo donax TaxID=35708 RepID=A0A0A8ZY82_ARUDO